nr:hypothetical protein [Tanacetum cinerariifolium]
MVKGKGKAIATDEQAVQSLLNLHKLKQRSTKDQFIIQRQTPTTLEESTRPSTQPQDDTSANIICESASPVDAETGANSKKTNNEAGTEVLKIDEEKGKELSNTVALEEKTVELDEGQARSNPGKTPESQPPPEQDLMKEDQAGSDPVKSHVAPAGPNPKSIHDDFVATVYPKVHESLKHTTEEHVHVENPLSSSGTLSSMKNLDNFNFGDKFVNDNPTKEDSSKTNVETKVESMVIVLIHQASSSAHPLFTPVIDLTPPKKVSSTIQEQALSSMIFTLELRYLSYKIDQTINEVVKVVVHVALQAPLRLRFRELPEADMKDILHQHMFESGSYKSLPKHVALYEALEASMKRANMGEFLAEKDKSRKRRCHRVVPDVSKPLPLGDPPVQVKIQTRYFFNKDLEYLVSSDKERRSALSISKLKAANYPEFRLEELVPSLWIGSEREYDISASHDISHWWFKHKEFYINRHSTSSNHHAVRSYMRILSVVSLMTISRYGYTYLKEIVLRIVDYKEYTISESDYQNLHPNDFEDLYLLHLQGKLNHLSGFVKVNLFNAVNMWIRNIVIKKQDASGFLFREDYTIVSKPRAIIYKDKNDQKKIIRETEVHKFSNGTLTRILEKLDHMVKDFKLFKYNLGMEIRIWSEDDRKRSKVFMKVIEARLKTRRFFRSLESFVSVRLRDVDYTLI